jgi:hypothetical protein
LRRVTYLFGAYAVYLVVRAVPTTVKKVLARWESPTTRA